MKTLPDAIKNHPVKTTVGVLFAAASAFGGAVWKLALAWEARERRMTAIEQEAASARESFERDLRWLRRDVEAAIGEPVTRYYYESDVD